MERKTSSINETAARCEPKIAMTTMGIVVAIREVVATGIFPVATVSK